MMKNFRKKLSGLHYNGQEVEIFNIYLLNKHFRGFYYDSDDRSYGIVLSLSSSGNLKLFAQETKSGSTLSEFRLQADNFYIEQTAYDKIIVSAAVSGKNTYITNNTGLELPEKMEFSIQILSRNSIYIRFLSPELFTPPISSFRIGLVLSREHHAVENKIEVEAENIF